MKKSPIYWFIALIVYGINIFNLILRNDSTGSPLLLFIATLLFLLISPIGSKLFKIIFSMEKSFFIRFLIVIIITFFLYFLDLKKSENIKVEFFSTAQRDSGNDNFFYSGKVYGDDVKLYANGESVPLQNNRFRYLVKSNEKIEGVNFELKGEASTDSLKMVSKKYPFNLSRNNNVSQKGNIDIVDDMDYNEDISGFKKENSIDSTLKVGKKTKNVNSSDVRWRVSEGYPSLDIEKKNKNEKSEIEENFLKEDSFVSLEKKEPLDISKKEEQNLDKINKSIVLEKKSKKISKKNFLKVWKYDNRERSLKNIFSKKIGKNSYKFSNGDLYKGSVSNYRKNGKGLYKYSHGSKYFGYWKNDKPSGNGTFYWENGDKYKGKWSRGYRSGLGKYTWKNGSVFIGKYYKGVKHGLGKYIWKDGSYYKGNFINNKKDGKGIFVWSNGSVYKGVWKNDKIVGSGIYNLKKGFLVNGKFTKNSKKK